MKSSMNRFNSKLDTAEEIMDEPKDKSEKNCWGLSIKRKNMCMENVDEKKWPREYSENVWYTFNQNSS